MPSKRELPIGIFDSGLGGLTVLKELRRRLPNERFIYLGDTARTPYGSKSRETIQRYSLECARFLLGREIKLLVVACNTSSSLALSELTDVCPCPVIGTIEPAVAAAMANGGARRIGVIGTKGTIASSAYQTRLSDLISEVTIFAKACPLFVPLVEEGIYSGPIVDKIVEYYLSDFRSADLDALILGCTHYPLLSVAIRSYLGSKVSIVECSSAIAVQVSALLDSEELWSPSRPLPPDDERYFVTDDVSRFNYLASLFLERHVVEAVQVQTL